MYFNGKTLTAILSDAATETKAAPAIAAARRRFTSPVAVVETVLALGPAADGTTADQRVQAFLDAAGIEIRDMPPSHRLIAAAAEGGTVPEVIDRACADYYEAEPFTLADLPAAAEKPSGA